jgi:hypothetical protein
VAQLAKISTRERKGTGSNPGGDISTIFFYFYLRFTLRTPQIYYLHPSGLGPAAALCTPEIAACTPVLSFFFSFIYLLYFI